MGSGGNLVRNILSLAPNFELLGFDRMPVDNKSEFLIDFYKQDVSSDTWLSREWSIRQALYNRYYVGNIPAYYNPPYNLVYDNHGILQSTNLDNHLLHYDRYRVNKGMIEDKTSEFSLRDCAHVFVTYDNLDTLAKIYNSKNPSIDQYSHLSLDKEQRLQQFKEQNFDWYQNIIEISEIVDRKELSGEVLFTDDGVDMIMSIIKSLDLSIDENKVHQIHTQWLQSTREIYYNYYKENL
jgi:hypothetical protein